MSQEKPTATGAGMKRWRAWRSSWPSVWLSPRRLRFWLLMALALYTLAGFFLLPWLIERGAVKAILGLIGRIVTSTFRGAELSLKRLDVQAVKAAASGEIPLQLKVSADGHGE